MTINWTPERVSKLSNSELKSLLKNAIDYGKTTVAEICEAEIKLRQPKPKVKYVKPIGAQPIVRTPQSSKLEKDLCGKLLVVWNALTKIYDFDPDRARALSAGTERFVPHKLLDSKGQPKTGGAQQGGRVVFDRYISYRLKSEVYALLGILYKDDGLKVRYQVFGPSRLLDGFIPLNEIRPYLETDETIGLSAGGLEYETFEEAAEKFKWLIEQVAPKLR